MNILIKILAAAATVAALVFVVATARPKYGPPRPIYPISAYSLALNKAIAADQAQVGPTAPKAAAGAAGVRLHPVGVELPIGGRGFPSGACAYRIAANCTACQTCGMILNQPTLTRAAWAAKVNKTVKLYKTPVEQADIPAIIAYLATLKGGVTADDLGAASRDVSAGNRSA